MHSRKVVLSLALALAVVLCFFTLVPTGSAAPETVANWVTTGNKTKASDFLGTTNNKPLIFKTNKVERMRLDTSGNVGIGTSSPTSKLEIAAQDGLAITGYQPFLTLRDTNASNKRSLIQSANGGIDIYPNSFIGGSPAFVINDVNGHVGIGTSQPLSTLMVQGADSQLGSPALLVKNSSGTIALGVWNAGNVAIGTLQGTSTSHICYTYGGSLPYYFAACSSAAENVPSTDDGNGYPETADLVSIAPNLTNPYGDTHGPFTVQKSSTPCDSNLLGFIVKPESGADGPYLNNHYLPLAIYGYFPAKVTMENGTIHRGDPLTSSSKPGYAMKATDACKTIGYALEDATTDGTIQVFAHLSENAAPEVAALKGKVDALTQENSALKQELSSIEARLSALEQASPVSHNTTGVNASQP